MFGLGGLEFVIFLVIVLLLFGKKLPGLARSLGLSFTEFKKGVQGVEEGDDAQPRDTQNIDQPASKTST